MYRETTVELKPRDKPRGDEAKIQINDLEHKEDKNDQSEQPFFILSKKMRIV